MATRLITGIGDITAAIAKFQSNIKKSWCACVDSSIPAFSMSDAIKQGYVAAKERGVKIRYVTEITNDNATHCIELTKFVELRHLDRVSGSFAVSESEFVAGISGKKTLDKLVYSDEKELVQSQQNVFETLWENAMPAKDRIQDLER
ncbi:MAG: hypothetical protein ACREAY_06060 [Nitrososphaera sp.]|uniref:hypothetical protein n=1 Tax=Nitrososphaera sp. TaxID=1971748 RepID=UPI003D6F8497